MTHLKLKHIAVGRQEGVWAVLEADGAVARLVGAAGAESWVSDRTGKAVVVAPVNAGEAWCVNREREIWHVRDANTAGGGTWVQVPTHTGRADARTIAVGVADGTVWYANDSDGSLYFRENDAWHRDPAGKAVVVAAVNKTELWCVNLAHEIWHLSGTQWTKPGTPSGRANVRTISVSADGGVWCAQLDGQLFRREAGAWKPDPTGRGVVLAAAGRHDLWCVNDKSEAWHLKTGQWSKVAERAPEAGTWSYALKGGETLAVVVANHYETQTGDWTTVNRIVAEITRLNTLVDKDKVAAGAVLVMPPLSYR